MKNQIISLLGLAALILLSGCTFVETPEPTTHTTRTTTAEVTPTVYGTVETKTTQTY
jgi:multidrug efflux pump subunit AcrA (membrane-fusion protein)